MGKNLSRIDSGMLSRDATEFENPDIYSVLSPQELATVIESLEHNRDSELRIVDILQ